MLIKVQVKLHLAGKRKKHSRVQNVFLMATKKGSICPVHSTQVCLSAAKSKSTCTSLGEHVHGFGQHMLEIHSCVRFT